MTPQLLAAGVSSVGQALVGFGKFQASRSQAAQLKAQARNARQEAGIAASISLEESERVGARAATLAAASGGGGLKGSALAVIDDLARQGMYRARQTVRDGVSQSVALRNQAKSVRRQGMLDLFGSLVGASSTALGSMGTEAQARRGTGQ